MAKSQVKIGIKPPHPGLFIFEEIIAPLDLSIAKAAEVLGVRRATLSDLINGKSSVSAEMAMRIEKAFGFKMEMLLKMQTWFDTCAMRERSGEIKVSQYVA
jgi:antitoxin HigA-1